MSAQEPTLEEQRETLRQQIEKFEQILEALESQTDGPNEINQRANYERQLTAAREKFAALPPLHADVGPNGPADVTSGEQPRDAPAHPIEAVAGLFVRMSDLLQLKIGNLNAFSDSTNLALREACRVPDRLTQGGEPVVGPGAFLKSVLALSARALPGDANTLGEALVAHLSQIAPDRRSYLAALTATSSSVVAVSTFGAQAPASDLARGAAEGLAEPSLPPGSTSADESLIINKAIVSGDLTRMLADAAGLARELGAAFPGGSIAHAIIAALRCEQGQAVFRDLGLIDGDPQSFFTGLSNVVLAFLEQPDVPFSSVPVTARVDAARSVATVRIRVAPETVSSVRFVADVPETSLRSDRLGMADDAESLAEVMCLREPGPPLAIGLFGDWGSGKSTFMNMIEAAVGELTTRTAKDDVGRATFVSNVVHIRFNAWHYNDANLWASITSEFFAQLRSGGAGSQAKKTYEALVGEVLARVESLDGEAARAAIEAAAARGEAIDHQRSLDRIEDQRRDIVGTALKETVQAFVPGSRPAELAKVRRALEALGRRVELSDEEQKDKPDAVRQAVADMAEREIGDIAESSNAVAATLSTVFKAVRKRPVTYALGLAAVLWVVAIGWVARNELVRWIPGVGLLLAPIALAWRDVQPILVAARTFLQRRQEQSEALDRERRETERKLADAKQRTQAAEQARTKTESDAARFKGASPDRVFDYYLNVSADTQQFEQQLGTISRVRRVFEQLNAIYRERQANGPPVTPVIERAGQQANGFNIDRIVLYIDDLDRCQFEQVVKVLEAVHLLLAFPLFVVVVGVDPRWLQQSLLSVYKDQLQHVGQGATNRATVQDYLEKIFQIPIQLRQLSTREQTELRPYLNSVAGPVETAQSRDAVPNTQTARAGAGDGLRPVNVVLRPVEETARETATRVMLRKDELDMIERLAPFVGKSPRTIKRFMNVYRLARGRRRGDRLDAFLSGVHGGPAEFAACQLWLALDMGLTPELKADYAALLHDTTMPDFPDWVTGRAAYNASFSQESVAIVTRLRESLDADTRARHAEALNAVLSFYPKPNVRWPLLKSTQAEMRRFSLPTLAAAPPAK